jgi:hypothetical protein
MKSSPCPEKLNVGKVERDAPRTLKKLDVLRKLGFRHFVYILLKMYYERKY